MFINKLKPAQTGFTLIELIAVILVLATLSTVAFPLFSSISDEADQAQIDAVLSALKTGEQLVKIRFYTAGSPGIGQNVNTTLIVGNIPVRFRNGQIRTTLNSNHVPPVPQNTNAAYTRLFFLFLQNAPGDIVARNSLDQGWAMLGNNASCAAGPNPRRCWEYRRDGSRIARISYFTTTGVFLKD